MTPIMTRSRRSPRNNSGIPFVRHPSFQEATAPEMYYWDESQAQEPGFFTEGYMPDEVTRDLAKRMHYAAYRHQQAKQPKSAARWQRRYLQLRNQIIVGNRKLVFRAVRQKITSQQYADDLYGECHVVLIRAVAAFNPWLGIRFSTYAFTCLMRALARLNRRLATDRLLQAVPLAEPADSALGDDEAHDLPSQRFQQVDEYLRPDHPLLSPREKTVLRRRYHLGDAEGEATLEAVGHDLGLSKERIRQLQISALGKLRQALLEASLLS